VKVLQDFKEFSQDEGYLVLSPGDEVSVAYVGQDPAEIGWMYGVKVSNGNGEQGWFPEWVMNRPQETTTSSWLTSGVEEPPRSSIPEAAPAAFAATSLEPAYPDTGIAHESSPHWEDAAAASEPALPPQPISAASVTTGAGSQAAARQAAAYQAAAADAERPQPQEQPQQTAGLSYGAQRKAAKQEQDLQRNDWWCGSMQPPQPAPQNPAQASAPAAPSSSTSPYLEQGAFASMPGEMSSSGGLVESGFDRQPQEQHRDAYDHIDLGIRKAAYLPVANLEEDLVALSEAHRVVVIDAATGSGKSTLVPLFLAKNCLGRGRDCRMVVTQPRRMAAKELARHVQDKTETEHGELIGFRIGGARSDQGAMITYVTVGHLLEALVHSPDSVLKYSHIILDEVHERFVQADFMMALLRLLLSRRETAHIRIIVMSATMQHSWSDFFRPLLFPCPATATLARASLPGQKHFDIKEFTWDTMVEEWPWMKSYMKVNFIEHTPKRMADKPFRRRSTMLSELCNKEQTPACAQLLSQNHEKHMREQSADTPDVTLVFLPGLDAMRELSEEIGKDLLYRRPPPEVILMHSSLDEETYKAAHDKPEPGAWRIILATNIAESSLTIPSLRTVIDYGLHRVDVYDDDTRMSVLATEWCSKASMRQRMGRTGRTNDGVYVRLMPACIYAEVPDFDESDVQRAPLTRVTLEAAHLAKLFNEKRRIYAGFPVVGTGGPELKDARVEHFDLFQQRWQITENIHDASTYAGKNFAGGEPKARSRRSSPCVACLAEPS